MSVGLVDLKRVFRNLYLVINLENNIIDNLPLEYDLDVDLIIETLMEVFGEKVFAYESSDLHKMQHGKAGREGTIDSSSRENM